TYVDTSRVDSVRAAMRPNTKIVYLETPTNPMMTLTDIPACSEVAHKAGALVVVDNTFCSPYLQRPIELGADIVVHSTTKFLNGHSDSVGGAVISNSDELAEKIGFLQNAVGAILSPFDSWLVLRGIKTLAVRMRRHEENGMAMASYLSNHPKVRKIYYPGLPDHPGHALAKRQLAGWLAGVYACDGAKLQRVDVDDALPGADLIRDGLRDIANGVESIPALLVLAGAPRLRTLGFDVPDVPYLPEHRLYELLAAED